MANAIASAFTWKDSHEGRQFWSDLYEYLCSNPENPKFPSISDLYAAQLRTSQTTLVPADAPKGEPKQTKKHTTMLSRYASQPVATPTLVFGTDVEDLDENQTVNAIKASQAAIKANAELGVESPRITQLTDGHKAAIAALVSHLDSFATA